MKRCMKNHVVPSDKLSALKTVLFSKLHFTRSKRDQVVQDGLPNRLNWEKSGFKLRITKMRK